MHPLMVNVASVGDPSSPPLTVPPVGPLSVLPPVTIVTQDRLAPDQPGLGKNSGQCTTNDIDYTVGGTTMRQNPMTYATGFPPRPAPFLRENWSGAPQRIDRWAGNVGRQTSALDARTRLAVQDAIVIPTPAETAAAAVNPAVMATVALSRGGRFS